MAGHSTPGTQPAKLFWWLGSWDGEAEREPGRNESLVTSSSDGMQGDDNIGMISSNNPLAESRSTRAQAGDNC